MVVAVGFAALVNLALATSLVWNEMEPFTPPVRSIVWMGLALVWLVSAVYSVSRIRREPGGVRSAVQPDAFDQAVEHYLQQDWYETQRLLGRMLRANPRDVDVRLMLASVLRRTGQWDEADEELDRLERMEESRKWELEIGRERECLAEARAESRRASLEPDAVPVQTRRAA
ncbi:MAG: tetratricopeptide repeat protein [Pirellulales bacterium]|nr:tetratricopeptide repeat protein [Pirellulales bacterium]